MENDSGALDKQFWANGKYQNALAVGHMLNPNRTKVWLVGKSEILEVNDLSPWLHEVVTTINSFMQPRRKLTHLSYLRLSYRLDSTY